MKNIKALRILAALGVALLGLGSAGFAQSQFNGKFTLTSRAYWGKTVLEPGEHTISILADGDPHWLVVTGQNQQAIVMAVAKEDKPVFPYSSLTLVTVDGKNYVRDVEVGDIGLVLTYRVPTSPNMETAGRANSQGQARKVAKKIPISAAGKSYDHLAENTRGAGDFRGTQPRKPPALSFAVYTHL